MSVAEQWFVVQTNPQREAFVGEQLSSLEPYLPQFKNLKGAIRPLFPRYLFVPALVHWGSICTTVGVRCLLMSGDHPAIIKGTVIKGWRAKERGGLVQLPPPPRFRSGERLTILSGSLRHRTVIHAGMVGKDRERVLIEMLGHTISLIVATADLAPEFRPPPPRNRLRPRRETLNRQESARFVSAV